MISLIAHMTQETRFELARAIEAGDWVEVRRILNANPSELWKDLYNRQYHAVSSPDQQAVRSGLTPLDCGLAIHWFGELRGRLWVVQVSPRDPLHGPRVQSMPSGSEWLRLGFAILRKGFRSIREQAMSRLRG